MAFVRQIESTDATGELREFYREMEEIAGGVPNIVKLSSLKVAAIRAAQDLYQSVLYHDSGLTMLEKEMVATLVSALNGCAYCVEHHGAAIAELSGSTNDASWVAFAYRQANVDERGAALLSFAEKLTMSSSSMQRSDIDELRAAGLSDEDVVDLVQLVAYFNYTNRIATALGVDPEE